MVEALRMEQARANPAGRVELIETHVSWVLLSGDQAYKIKKAVGLDFLDYSTLEDRRFFCQEELRLNRRTAPELYLDILPITGSPEAPAIDGRGPVIDYAVHMRRFESTELLSSVLQRDLPPDLDQALAAALARFHLPLKRSNGSSLHGMPDEIRNATSQVCASLSAMMQAAEGQHALRTVSEWIEGEGLRLESFFAARRKIGRVRECHGDLHCDNIIVREGHVRLFDGIEFSASLRTIDVIDDLAFLLMDLQARGHATLALRCLNHYLEISGDYDGLRVLRYYICYRALVRAMVGLLRGGQSDAPISRAEAGAMRYMQVARRQTLPVRPALILTHGFSGVGKSSLALALCSQIGAIRLRADAERARLYGSGSGVQAGKYSAEADEATYEQLAHLATLAVSSGWPVVVDATFLQRTRRDRFRDLAQSLDVPLVVVAFDAPEAVLRARILERTARGGDPSEAGLEVLARQLATAQPVDPAEPGLLIRYDATRPLAEAQGPEAWRPLPELLRRGPPID